jgi:protein ImuB
MAVAEARALVPDLRTEDHDPAADRAELEALADLLLRFSPATAVMDAATLAADIAGVDHLFGGEAALLDRAARLIISRGYPVGAAAADSPGAAWALSREPGARIVVEPGEELAALSGLPVGRLRLPAETVAALRSVGVATVGQLAALPRSQVPARFGEAVLPMLDRALGRLREVVTPRRPPPLREARREFDFPLGSAAEVLSAAEGPLGELLDALTREEAGVRELEVLLFPDGSPPVSAAVALSRPTRSARRLLGLLALRLEATTGSGDPSVSPAGPVEAMAVRVLKAEPFTHRQDDFLDADSARLREAFAELVESLSAEFGPGSVAVPADADDHLPERSVRRDAPDDAAEADRGAAIRPPDAEATPPPPPGSRPWRLLRPPEPVDVTTLDGGRPLSFAWRGRTLAVAEAVGPERLESGWWRGGYARRDYWAVETDDGARFWLYRHLDSGHWHLHGLFD